MCSAGLVQMNGFGFSFQPLTQLRMSDSSHLRIVGLVWVL